MGALHSHPHDPDVKAWLRISVFETPAIADSALMTLLCPSTMSDSYLTIDIYLERVGKPEEIAASIVFLSCDSASFITGATIAVDGGKTVL